MIFKWETEEERLKRHMKISPKKKLEWLRQMNDFIEKFTTKKQKSIIRKLKKY